MTMVIDAIQTQLGPIIQDLKNNRSDSGILDDHVFDENSQATERSARDLINHKLDIKVGICVLGACDADQ